MFGLCGITGFTTKNWQAPDDRIRIATNTLIHRGPDQQGVFRSGLFSMGATRLKIIDLQGGDQPILSLDGDAGIVFNGEIYNHLEVRAELEKLGHKFVSHSDTETVLHAFLEWDKRCFARLRGMFAVALWRKSQRRVVLARDRMGIKPLYFFHRGEDVFFGSVLKALFAHPEIDRRLSMEGLDCYLGLNYIPYPYTLVEGIKKLPPGNWLEWADGTISTGAFWELPYGVSSGITLEAAKEELDALLDSSVREHLLSDVPLGVWLSGGVDSTTILHYAAHASRSKLKTFSISFQGRSFDESQYINRAVQCYGTEHEVLDLSPDKDLGGAIEQFAHFSDEPSADAGALPVWFLSKLCRTQTTVALSGEGADEMFGGYLTYRANRMAARFRSMPQSTVRMALAAIRNWPVSDDKISFEYKVKRFLQGTLMTPSRAHVFWNGTFTDEEKAQLVKAPLPSTLASVLAQMASLPTSSDDLAKYLWFDQKYFLNDDILTKSDRMSMAHSVEVRPPFLDHRLVEFAAKLPASLKIRGSQQKFVLKELMRDKLPREILDRKKSGLDIPAHDWMRGPLRSLLQETIEDGLERHKWLFHPEVVRNLVASHLARRVNAGYQLWGLMIMLLWMKHWQIEAPKNLVTKA